MLTTVFKSAFLLTGVASAAMAAGMFRPAAQMPVPAPSAPMVQPVSAPAQQMVQQVAPAPAYDPIQPVLADWKRLQQSDNYPFGDYARFLLAHPGFPGETSRRAAAETVLADGGQDAATALRFFTRYPPMTSAGRLRYAEALAASGRMAEAQEAARTAWRRGALRTTDETKLLGQFASALRPEDHDARMDRLLWQGATSAAGRQIGYVSATRRPTFDARIAFRTSATDASVRGEQPGVDRTDPGYIGDRATWLRATGQSVAARSYLAQPRRLSRTPGDVEEWLEVLLTNARAAQADSQYDLAYRIASQIDDAFPAGTVIADAAYGERDDYTSLAWLAGTAALQRLNRPADAAGMFARYASGSRTPTVRTKGYYWAGRAAEAAGDRATADRWYGQAADLGDLFYGQLASERIGRPLRAPGNTADPAAIPAAVRAAYMNSDVVKATRYLGRTGQYGDQGLFIRKIAEDARSDTDHALAVELAQAIDRPDLAVMVGRSALLNGHSDYTLAGYPSVPVGGPQQNQFTLIHAIARQESQFDRTAVSRAGARGLMQLMPGTARETAGKLGLSYNPTSLNDPAFNMALGSSYIQRMLDYYGGSYPLAIAAYNAGPGNVNKFIRANGDPRTPGVDVVDWIEKIPLSETRGYVQRVLENAVVYDLIHANKARSRGPNNLSWYLGKNRPG
ncbi:lytic transglycosylase domain-containing protein [Sphingomonas hankookensis]|uniref:lytic transglycosylase domain-containing protein n=1 Tax=Sphingomonas hankookensis TaxID=563996 RepID=UPI00362B3EEF